MHTSNVERKLEQQELHYRSSQEPCFIALEYF